MGEVSVQADFNKTSESYSEEGPELPQKPGSIFRMKTVSIGRRLLPEIQAWVDDGRITRYELVTAYIFGKPNYNTFWFSDPNHAMHFKLIYG